METAIEREAARLGVATLILGFAWSCGPPDATTIAIGASWGGLLVVMAASARAASPWINVLGFVGPIYFGLFAAPQVMRFLAGASRAGARTAVPREVATLVAALVALGTAIVAWQGCARTVRWLREVRAGDQEPDDRDAPDEPKRAAEATADEVAPPPAGHSRAKPLPPPLPSPLPAAAAPRPEQDREPVSRPPWAPTSAARAATTRYALLGVGAIGLGALIDGAGPITPGNWSIPPWGFTASVAIVAAGAWVTTSAMVQSRRSGIAALGVALLGPACAAWFAGQAAVLAMFVFALGAPELLAHGFAGAGGLALGWSAATSSLLTLAHWLEPADDEPPDP